MGSVRLQRGPLFFGLNSTIYSSSCSSRYGKPNVRKEVVIGGIDLCRMWEDASLRGPGVPELRQVETLRIGMDRTNSR